MSRPTLLASPKRMVACPDNSVVAQRAHELGLAHRAAALAGYPGSRRSNSPAEPPPAVAAGDLPWRLRRGSSCGLAKADVQADRGACAAGSQLHEIAHLVDQEQAVTAALRASPDPPGERVGD